MNKIHLAYARNCWEKILFPGDIVIDATVGTGQDTFFLAHLLKGEGQLIGYDIQLQALEQARRRLENLPPKIKEVITLKHHSHAQFEELHAKLIVYNLGYLPGGDKSLTTLKETTLKSIQNALKIVDAKGAISITCYPGHDEGEREEAALMEFLKALPSKEWEIGYHQWINRPRFPTFFWIKPALHA